MVCDNIIIDLWSSGGSIARGYLLLLVAGQFVGRGPAYVLCIGKSQRRGSVGFYYGESNIIIEVGELYFGAPIFIV